jgi:hypothetical protein
MELLQRFAAGDLDAFEALFRQHQKEVYGWVVRIRLFRGTDMSTRGCIAVGTLKNWKGIYNHSDSYPTWLGPELWEHLIRQQLEGKTLAEIGRNILSFDDWRNYLQAGLCEYCGKLTGQAHSIRGDVYRTALDPLKPSG